MSMMDERRMEITFTGGNKIRFKFPVQATDESVAQRMEEILKLPSMTVNAGNVLYVIPTSAIQMITVTPAPRKLPRTVFRAAKVVQ
jgi:hypothetical protein